MVPRIHKRGQSFKGACQYILHDAQKDSSDRVLWSHTVNLGDVAPDDAWQAMYATWNDRTKLKREAGVDLRGRDNTHPVLHMTLAWAQDEKPDNKHMLETALSAMKALGLENHQAQIAAHSDKEHIHVHLVINTVHPETGRTAPLKYSKEAMSRWAEAYEREHGIHCEQRIKNNEERDRIRAEKNASEKDRSKDRSRPKKKRRIKDRSDRSPDEPRFKGGWTSVKDRTPPRPYALEQKAIVDRMRRLRTEINHRQLVERDVTASRHRAERDELYKNSRSATAIATDHVSDRFRSRWRDLFAEQRKESSHLNSIQDNLFERACYVFANSHRLGSHKPLTLRDKVRLILSPRKLFEAVARVHKRERNMLSAVQKVETRSRLDRIWEVHTQRNGALLARQAAERAAEREQQKGITENLALFKIAHEQLLDERAGEQPVRRAAGAPDHETDADYVERVRDDTERYYERRYPHSGFREPAPASEAPARPEAAPASADSRPLHDTFNQAKSPEPPPAPSRAQQIKKDMERWRRRIEGRDPGREL